MKHKLQNLTPKFAYALMMGTVLFAASCSPDEPTNSMPFDEPNLGSNNGQVIEGRYIVRFKTGTIDKSGKRLSPDYDLRQVEAKQLYLEMTADYGLTTESVDKVYSSTIEGFSANLSTIQVERLKADANVAFIEPDRVISIAQGKGKPGGGGGSTGQVTPWGITRVGGSVNYTGNNVAWILDSGIDLTHPDLNVQTTNGFTAFTSGKDANLNDGNGHGTHVAGTVAAINNTIGVVGVAAGAPVVPVKVLDSRGSGSYSGVIAGVDHVGAKGKSGDVANMSLGGPVSQALDDAIIAASSKGIRFVLAAGNESKDANTTSPARVNGPNIYTISASDVNDRFATFSNFGNPPVDYAAPGVSINSTWKGGGYNTISGTSMAAPHAAGVLLLGTPKISGYVTNDRDNTPDPIISR